MTQIINNTAARLQALPHLHAVPQEKLARMVFRTLLGALFVGLGLILLLLQIRILYATQDIAKLSLWLVLIGIGLLLLGASTWSTQIVITPLKVLITVFGEALTAWRQK